MHISVLMIHLHVMPFSHHLSKVTLKYSCYFCNQAVSYEQCSFSSKMHRLKLEPFCSSFYSLVVFSLSSFSPTVGNSTCLLLSGSFSLSAEGLSEG